MLSAVAVHVSILTSMLYANLLAQTHLTTQISPDYQIIILFMLLVYLCFLLMCFTLIWILCPK